ncbi:hypothetical protein WME94_18040 [Sorangium sp. So ce429]
MKKIDLLVCIGIVAILPACSMEISGETSGDDPDVAAVASALTPQGNQCGVGTPVDNNAWYRVMANFYNAGSGTGCITWNQSTNWNWFTVSTSTVSASTRGAPAGYPAVYQGCHYGTCSGGGYPRVVSGITSMRSNWYITGQPGGGAWDASYDIWFNTYYNPSQGYPNGLELMIWQDYRGSITPAGSRVYSGINWNGRTYDKWVGSVNGTKVVSYVRTSGEVNQTNFDLMPFIRDCMQWDGLQSAWFLQSVQAGFEIWTGGQGLTTTEFDVTVQ